MSFLKDVVKDMREPLVEGRGIKVFPITEENKYQVACQKTGKRYVFNTSKNYNVGDIVTMDGRRRKVVKVLKEARHDPMFNVLNELPDVTKYIDKHGPHLFVDKACGCKDGDEVKFTDKGPDGRPSVFVGVVRDEGDYFELTDAMVI